MNPRIDTIGHGAPQQASHSGIAPKPGIAFSRVFEQAVRDVDRAIAIPDIEATEPLDARGALELQAAVYRHAERVEIVSRIVDHGVAAVKTVLQTRV